MLRIEREYKGSGGIRVRMTGHADAALNEHGHDLVCAASSMLTYTLAEAFERYCVRPTCDLKPGDTLLEGTPRIMSVGYFRAAYEAIMVGYERLAHQYPDCIEVCEWI